MDISVDSTLGKPKKRRKISEVASSFFASASGKLDRTLNAAEVSFLEVEPPVVQKKYFNCYICCDLKISNVI